MQVAMKILDNLAHNQVRLSVSLVCALRLCAVGTLACRYADAALAGTCRTHGARSGPMGSRWGVCMWWGAGRLGNG